MTAPERIWAWTSGQAAGIFDTSFHDNAGSAIEYVRADLATVPAQVKVKPLVWGWNESLQGWRADCELTRDVFCAYETNAGWVTSSQTTGSTIHANADAAKSALDGYRAARILAAIEPQPDPRDEHFDDYAVRSFAKMMAAKMAASRAKGRGGWSDPAQCSVEYLRQLLYAHLDKGDPVDVANICMMLRHYEASTAHEYESSAMAAACASRDKVIARMVEALTNLRDLMCESFEDDDGNLGCGQCENDCTGCIAHAALAAAKAVQR